MNLPGARCIGRPMPGQRPGRNRKDMHRAILTAMLLLLLAIPASGAAEQPIDILEKSVDVTIRVLKDPRFREADQKKLQAQKLWEIAREIFDFDEFSMRALGPLRKNFSARQQKEFTGVFSEFLARYYLRRLQEKYRDEKVVFISQEFLTDSRATVNVRVLWNDMQIPVDIRMIKRSETWKAYDVVVFGVSAVHNYRVQFNELMHDGTPAQIISLVRKRLEQEDSAAGSR